MQVNGKYIRKYGSAFYVGIGQVKNGRLWQLWENHSKISQNSYRQKTFGILLLKMAQEFCYPTQKLRKKLENFYFVILLSSFSSFFCM